MIDLVATEPHYAAHLLPVAEALGSDLGTFHLPGPKVAALVDYPNRSTNIPDRHTARPLLAADYGTIQQHRYRPVVLAEHGAGQQYRSPNPAYAGGLNRDHVALFLCPNEHVAAANRRTYPGTPSVTVGVPLLDAHAYRVRTGSTVVLTWHWDNTMWPESRSAFDHYKGGLGDVVGELRADGWTVLGHAHPRAWAKPPSVGGWYEAWGVEPVFEFGEVLRRADVLVCDQSSAAFLSAAVGVRQVVLDAPWYAGGYAAGLFPRFSVPLGVRVSGPGGVRDAVGGAWCPDVSEVVPWVGGCGGRAAAAIRAVFA